MLKKETFISAIQAIQKQEKLTDQINRLYGEMTEGMGALILGGLTTPVLVSVLEDGMEDPYGYVSWWLYDAPREDKTVSWEEDEKIVTVNLADENALYDYLVRCAEERQSAM